MMNGRNNGKKLMAVRIVAHAFEIVRRYIPHSNTPPQRDTNEECVHRSTS